MIIIGLTGSIGMGKSTTAEMFRQEGIPVHDADNIVHELYQSDLVAPINELFPGVIKNGSVDRQALGKAVLKDPSAMKKLEGLVHPAVRRKEEQFLRDARAGHHSFVVLDIPLLFETGGDKRVDRIIVVTADPEIQKQRVLSRPNMDEDKFQSILDKQVPDQEKRKRADFIIDTGVGMEHARAAVKKITQQLKEL